MSQKVVMGRPKALKKDLRTQRVTILFTKKERIFLEKCAGSEKVVDVIRRVALLGYVP